jgi:hypothetical protein
MSIWYDRVSLNNVRKQARVPRLCRTNKVDGMDTQGKHVALPLHEREFPDIRHMSRQLIRIRLLIVSVFVTVGALHSR